MTRGRTFALITRYSIMVVIALLIVEFLLGMWVNLYATLPVGTKLTLSQQPDFSGKLEVGIHLIAGVLLGIVSVLALIFSAFLKKVVPSVLGAVGLVATIVAGLAGLAFANGGYSNNGESYAMSITFLVAILVYINFGRLVDVSKSERSSSWNSNPPRS